MSDKLGMKFEAYITHPKLVDTEKVDVEVLVDAARFEALVESIIARVGVWDVIRRKLGL